MQVRGPKPNGMNCVRANLASRSGAKRSGSKRSGSSHSFRCRCTAKIGMTIERAGLDRLPAQRHVLRGEARHDGRRRIEAHGLLQHRARDGQPLEVLGADRAAAPTTAPISASDALLPLRRAGEEIERPGQRLGGGLVAGGEEGHEIVDELLLRHRLAGLGVLRARQARQQVVALRGPRRAGAPGSPRPPPRNVRAGPAAAELARIPQPCRAGAASPRRCPRRWWRAPCRRRLRIAAASASALPANIVAEMTWKVVSVMSRSIGCDGCRRAASRQRATWSSAAAVMVGTRPARSAGRNSGAAVRRCQRQLAPSEVRMPSPSVWSNTRFSSGVLGNCALAVQQHLLDQGGVGDPGDDVAAVVVDDDRLLVDRPRQARRADCARSVNRKRRSGSGRGGGSPSADRAQRALRLGASTVGHGALPQRSHALPTMAAANAALTRPYRCRSRVARRNTPSTISWPNVPGESSTKAHRNAELQLAI